MKKCGDGNMEKFQTCEILKTNIAVTNMSDTLRYLGEHLEELKGQYICVSNVHTTVMSYESEAYRFIQNSAAFALPDGKPLSVVSRKMGFPEAQRVTGPDLMGEVFALSEKKGYTHYFYGSKEDTLEQLKKKLSERYPKLQVVGMVAPPFRPLTNEEDEKVCENIRQTNADFLWIGLGAPKQEQWMFEHRGKFPSVMLGVGAGFDFHAGTIKRAPMWIQNVGMEWFYRICQDPKRLWKRYMKTNLKFIKLLIKTKNRL